MLLQPFSSSQPSLGLELQPSSNTRVLCIDSGIWQNYLQSAPVSYSVTGRSFLVASTVGVSIKNTGLSVISITCTSQSMQETHHKSLHQVAEDKASCSIQQPSAESTESRKGMSMCPIDCAQWYRVRILAMAPVVCWSGICKVPARTKQLLC